LSNIHHHFPGHPHHQGIIAPASTGASVRPGTPIVRVHQQRPDQWAPVCWENLWDSFGGSYVAPADPAKDNWDDLKSPSHWEESKTKEGSSREGSPLLGHLTRVLNPESMTALLENDEFRINEFEVDTQGYLLDNDSDSSAGGDNVRPSVSSPEAETFSQIWNNSYWGDNTFLVQNAGSQNQQEQYSGMEGQVPALIPNIPQQGEDDLEAQQSSPSSALGDNELMDSMPMDDSSCLTSQSDLSALPTPTSPIPSSPFSSTSSPEQGSCLEDKDNMDPLKTMLLRMLLSRDTIGRWLEDPYFDRLVRGCYVRALVGSSLRSSGNGIPTPVYRIARIAEVQNNCYPIYNLEPHNIQSTRKGIMLQVGNSLRMVSLQSISNRLPTEQEYLEWREDADKMSGGHGLTLEEVKEKLEIIQLLDLKYPHQSATVNKVEEQMPQSASTVIDSYSYL